MWHASTSLNYCQVEHRKGRVNVLDFGTVPVIATLQLLTSIAKAIDLTDLTLGYQKWPSN